MKIIDERIQSKTVSFMELNLGSFFVGQNTGNLYIKTSFSGDSPNSLNLTTQSTEVFTSFTSVTPVVVEIHIVENKK